MIQKRDFGLKWGPDHEEQRGGADMHSCRRRTSDLGNLAAAVAGRRQRRFSRIRAAAIWLRTPQGAEDRLDVELHGVQADEEPHADLLVGAALGEELKDLELALAERH